MGIQKKIIMKKKYLTAQVLIACKRRPARKREDIHVLLAMTIAERKKVIREWRISFFATEEREMEEVETKTAA
jgi:hypothetical protein